MKQVAVIAVSFALIFELAASLQAQPASPVPPPPPSPFGSGTAPSVGSTTAPLPPAPNPLTEVHATCADSGSCDAVQFEAGAALYLLRPFFESNPAYTSIGNTATTGTMPDFDWNGSASPAVWFGVSNPCGLGFRTRYFRFEQDSKAAMPDDSNSTIYPAIDTSFFFGTGNGFTAPGYLQGNFGIGQDKIAITSKLEIDVFDMEATYAFHPCEWTLLASLGLRYLHTHQDYDISLTNQATVGNAPVSEYQREAYGHNFSGLGPTVALDAKWPLVGYPGLSLYGNVRGSLLVGTQHEYLAWLQQVNDPHNVVGGSFVNTASIPFSHNQVFPMAEAEIGLEYQRRWGALLSLFRVGLVTQDYFNAGSATMDDGNLNLFGVQLTAGFCR